MKRLRLTVGVQASSLRDIGGPCTLPKRRMARNRGVVTIEFPYRPVINLQYWFADVAYVPQPDWDAMPPNDYPIYSPPLIVEVLSPSNTPAKINRRRIVAMSAGTEEHQVLLFDGPAKFVVVGIWIHFHSVDSG